MYATNLTKGQAFPLAIRVCSKPRSFKGFDTPKAQSLQIGAHLKPSLNLSFSKPQSPLVDFHNGSSYRVVGNGSVVKPRCYSSGFRVKSGTQNWVLMRGRGFSNWTNEKGIGGRSGEGRNRSRPPWLAAKEAKRLEQRATATKTPLSSWGESAKRLKKDSNAGSSGEEASSRGGDGRSKSSWDKSAKRVEEEKKPKTEWSSWEVSAEGLVGNGGLSERKRAERRNGMKDRRSEYSVRDRQSEYSARDRRSEYSARDRPSEYSVRDRRQEEANSEGSGEEEEMEAGDDPRWDQIKNKFRRMEDVNAEKPEYRRWDRQESWGRKTWQEASESSVPRLVGQGVYGVGPVLAALSAGRREFYTLYVQEGLDLSNNNKKKKDKKGFERVLRMAENFGVTIKELRKHDLNMAADNRPHQGLLLDASPLEMVKIKELDPISVEEDKGSLWVALDEVTDPQNLNEIVPSEPTILVLGSEGTGLRPLVERSCTQLIRIPGNIPVDVTAGGFDDSESVEVNRGCSAEEFRSFLAVESLNVSVAAGVLLHHLVGNNEKSEVHVVAQQNNGLDQDSTPH